MVPDRCLDHILLERDVSLWSRLCPSDGEKPFVYAGMPRGPVESVFAFAFELPGRRFRNHPYEALQRGTAGRSAPAFCDCL